MKRSPYHSIRAVSVLAPALYDDDADGTTVDLSQYQNYHRTASLVCVAGTVTDGTHTFAVEESDNGTDWTAVPASRLTGGLTALTSANDESVHEAGVTVERRYLRVTVAVTGTPNTGGLYSVIALLGDARREPVARS